MSAGFAGVSGPRVVGAVEPLQVFPGQGADVADGVGDGFTQRVMAHEPGLEVDAGEARPLDREVGDFLVAQAQPQCDRLEARPALAEALQPRDLLRLDQAQLRQALESVVDVRDLLRNQLELVGRQVLGEYAALTVEDQAANRRHSLDAHPVALGLGCERLVIEYL